jgi:hypothetical protein
MVRSVRPPGDLLGEDQQAADDEKSATNCGVNTQPILENCSDCHQAGLLAWHRRDAAVGTVHEVPMARAYGWDWAVIWRILGGANAKEYPRTGEHAV